MVARTGRSRRLKRWLANPIASVVLLGVLVGDALTLPRDWREATAVGRVVRSLLLTPRPTGWHFGPEFFVIREELGVRFIHPNDDSWDELSALLVRGDIPIAECSFRDSVYRSGLWAHVTEHHSRRLLIYPLLGTWSESDLAAARSAVFIESGVPSSVEQRVEEWQDITNGDLVENRVLLGGITHTAFALVIAAGLIYSLTGWPAWFAARPWSRSARRRSRGLCPSCAYELSGIESGVCPECGASVTHRGTSLLTE
jgi:hypothetical protein